MRKHEGLQPPERTLLIALVRHLGELFEDTKRSYCLMLSEARGQNPSRAKFAFPASDGRVQVSENPRVSGEKSPTLLREPRESLARSARVSCEKRRVSCESTPGLSREPLPSLARSTGVLARSPRGWRENRPRLSLEDPSFLRPAEPLGARPSAVGEAGQDQRSGPSEPAPSDRPQKIATRAGPQQSTSASEGLAP